MNASLNDEIRYKLLSLLKDNPSLTQREMMHKMGVSLGKINFCISALVQEEMIRVERFKNNSNKNAYLYHITPNGLKELAFLTLNFLRVKLEKYRQIKSEIRSLSEQINQIDCEICIDDELVADLRHIV